MADVFDLELHDEGDNNIAESDDDIIEVDDVSHFFFILIVNLSELWKMFF